MHEVRDLVGTAGVAVLLCTTIILIIKRRNTGPHGKFFIAACALLTLIEGYSTYNRATDASYNPSPVYIVGIEFFVFLLLLIYFHKQAIGSATRQISSVVIAFFLSQYLVTALIDETFFIKPPFITYLLGVLCVSANIILFLSQLFNSKKIFTLDRYFPFWACISTLIVYIGAVPLLIMRYYADLNSEIFYITLFLVHFLGHAVTIFAILRAKDEQ